MLRAEIAKLLPEVFSETLRDETPLAAMLDAMETLHAPSEAILLEVDRYFDPHRAPEPFLALLARWLDLDRVFDVDSLIKRDNPDAIAPGRMRELIAKAAHLSQWRGTEYALKSILQIATGCRDFEVIEGVDGRGKSRPFHILIKIPAEAHQHVNMIKRIVDAEKPAYVTYELESEMIAVTTAATSANE